MSNNIDPEDRLRDFFSNVEDICEADGIWTVEATMDFPNVYSLAQLETDGFVFCGMLHELYVFKYVGE